MYHPEKRPTMTFGTKASSQEDDSFGQERAAIAKLM
jgi:hypothetical protein